MNETNVILAPRNVPLMFKVKHIDTIKYGYFNGVVFVVGLTNPKMLNLKTLNKIIQHLPKIHHSQVERFKELP